MSYPRPLIKPNPFTPSAYQKTYQRCIDFEATAPQLKAIEGYPPPLISARLLGHLFYLVEGSQAKGQLSREINDAQDNETLMALAQHYLVTFIRAFKRSKGPTPAPTTHPSRSSFEDEREYWMVFSEEAGVDHRTAKRGALRRDGHRCVVTGLYDAPSWRQLGVTLPRGTMFTYTEAAHIIPEYTNTNISGVSEGGSKHRLSAGVWAALSMFGHSNVPYELNGDKIHRLENIITLTHDIHALFDNLGIWFKPDPNVQDQYTVHFAEDWMWAHLPQVIKFNTPDARKLPLPSPVYLKLHALCCEVAWMSGAGEYLDKIDRDMEEIRALAKDGSTAQLLSSALSLLAVH